MKKFLEKHWLAVFLLAAFVGIAATGVIVPYTQYSLQLLQAQDSGHARSILGVSTTAANATNQGLWTPTLHGGTTVIVTNVNPWTTGGTSTGSTNINSYTSGETSTNGTNFGSFTGNGLGLTGVVSGPVLSIISSFGNKIYYVSPTGSDTNNGLSTNAPLATLYAATTNATHYGDLIHLLPGINSNELAAPHLIETSNGVSIVADPGSVLMVTNFNGGNPNGAMVRIPNNATFSGLTLSGLDVSGGTLFNVLGVYGVESTQSFTNWALNNVTVISQSSGVGIEGNYNQGTISGVINNLTIAATVRSFWCLAEGEIIQIKVNGFNFSTLNSGAMLNTSPPCDVIRVTGYEGQTNSLVMQNGMITYSDAAGVATFGIYNRDTSAETNFVMDNVLFNPLNLQNAASSDITNRNAVTMLPLRSGVRRVDGKPLTETGANVAAGSPSVFPSPASATTSLNSPGALLVSNAWNAAVLNSIPAGSSWLLQSNGVPAIVSYNGSSYTWLPLTLAWLTQNVIGNTVSTGTGNFNTANLGNATVTNTLNAQTANIGSLTATNSIGSLSSTTNIVQSATGCTNTSSQNVTVYIQSVSNMSIFDHAGNAIVSGVNLGAGFWTFILQPGGSFTATATSYWSNPHAF